MEDIEVFVLFINASSLPAGVVVGDIPYARVTVYDDDCKCIHISCSE